MQQTLDRQAKLDGGVTQLRPAAPLAIRAAMPVHLFDQPDQQRATRLERCVVLFPIRRSVSRASRFGYAASLPDGDFERQVG